MHTVTHTKGGGVTNQHAGTEPEYRPLGLPGRYLGIHYQPVIVDDGELVVYVGQVQYVWRCERVAGYGDRPRMHLFNAYTGEPHPSGGFCDHVDKVCDRRLDAINS